MRKRIAQYLLCLTLGGWAAAPRWSAADALKFLLKEGPWLFEVVQDVYPQHSGPNTQGASEHTH
jgi:hypothetical protein